MLHFPDIVICICLNYIIYFSESSGRRQGLYHSQEMGNADLEPYFDLSGEISTQYNEHLHNFAVADLTSLHSIYLTFNLAINCVYGI